MNLPKIFVLGSNGMLGTYISTYFKQHGYLVIDVNRNNIDITKITEIELKDWFESRAKSGDVIVNCAGVIKPQIDKFGDLNGVVGNSVFPFLLANVSNDLKLNCIHITSDCVYSGNNGRYVETDAHDALDVYGKTKSLGEPKNCTVIRTSIIGEEKSNKRSLLEWIKSQKNKPANGYTNHFWNGVSCLELAKIINKIIVSDMYWNGVKHIFSSDVVSKYELLSIINDVYNLNISISSMETPKKCDRSLSSMYDTSSKLSYKTIREQVIEMYEFDLTGMNKIEINE